MGTYWGIHVAPEETKAQCPGLEERMIGLDRRFSLSESHVKHLEELELQPERHHLWKRVDALSCRAILIRCGDGISVAGFRLAA